MNSPQPGQDILVIDDNPNNLGVLSDLLQERGYRVRVAKNGRQGLEVARHARPDLIMLDINMPEMDGFEVCQELKADPALAEVPVIFLSAHEGAEEKVKAFELGGVDYIQKPFLIQEVLMRVRLHLRLASLQEELLSKNLSLASSNARLQDNANLIQHALMEAKALNRELITVNEKLRQSEEVQSRFLAQMRNEINNPLSSLVGLADQATRQGLTLEQIQAISSSIKAEASYLDFQIRNVFAAADLEAGMAIPAITRVDVDSVLLNVIDAFALEAEAKSVSVLHEPRSASGPLTFATDAGMLRIIMANLLANAIEHSPRGGTVRLRATLDGDSLVLNIQDEGSGIREEDQARIFDRFKQLEEGSTRVHRGQGLGLPVTKALVELLQGTILVQSEPGQGAAFTSHLPKFMAMDEANISSFEGNMFIFESPEER